MDMFFSRSIDCIVMFIPSFLVAIISVNQMFVNMELVPQNQAINGSLTRSVFQKRFFIPASLKIVSECIALKGKSVVECLDGVQEKRDSLTACPERPGPVRMEGWMTS
jgi:hypothetical protein